MNAAQTDTALAVVESQPVGILRPADTLDAIAEAFAQYQQVCERILNKDDYHTYEGKPRKKKSAWRKLATAFNVSTQKVSEEIQRSQDNQVLSARYTYRASTPTRQMEAEGYCEVKEKCCPASRREPCRKANWKGHYCCTEGCDGRKHWSHPEHDVIATAQTRASNRAIADLIGCGEVSAEELTEDTEIDARQAAREAESLRNASGQAGRVSGQPPQSKSPPQGQPDAKAGQNPQSQPKIGQVTDKARIDHPMSREDRIAALGQWLSKEFGPHGISHAEAYLHVCAVDGSDLNPALGLTQNGIKETLADLSETSLDRLNSLGKEPKESRAIFRANLVKFIEANFDNHPDLAPASHSSDMAGPGQASNPVGSVSAGPAQTLAPAAIAATGPAQPVSSNRGPGESSVAEQTSKGDRVNTPGAVSHPLPDNCPKCQSPRLEYGVNYGHRVGVCGACEHHFLADLALDKQWRTFPVPFGKAAGVQLGEMPKNTLFGWAMNYQPEPYKGKVSEKDKKFRAMLDLAAAVYAFKEKSAE